jgi:hypothetical protein
MLKTIFVMGETVLTIRSGDAGMAKFAESLAASGVFTSGVGIGCAGSQACKAGFADCALLIVSGAKLESEPSEIKQPMMNSLM